MNGPKIIFRAIEQDSAQSPNLPVQDRDAYLSGAVTSAGLIPLFAQGA